jgi:predicted alpha/beta-hydrolase family hydrolase
VRAGRPAGGQDDDRYDAPSHEREKPERNQTLALCNALAPGPLALSGPSSGGSFACWIARSFGFVRHKTSRER